MTGKMNKKVLAVSSGGGHWTQLLLLRDAFEHCDLHYVTTSINVGATQSQKNVSLVPDADLSSKLKLLPLAVKMFIIIVKRRPDIVISTGAAPGFFALLFGKFVGAKTVWVDSMANYSEMSVSGRHARRFCDLCLTQWPNLADGDAIHYSGSLL